MNKNLVFFVFLSSFLIAQVNYSNDLQARYGNSKNDYNYNEIYLNSTISYLHKDYILEAILSFENSNPPEIGLDQTGLRKYLIGYYNTDWSIELGDIYQTWGRGLLLNQLDYQNLDFDTGSRGVGIKFQSNKNLLNIIAGDVKTSKSTTSMSGYESRVPNYHVEQSIYGADYNFLNDSYTLGISMLNSKEDARSLEHVLSNIRYSYAYDIGDLYLSFINKTTSKDNELNFSYEKVKGSGIYLTNTNYINDWSLTSAYRSFKIDINDPIVRDNIYYNYGNALDFQQSPTGYFQHTFRLLSRNSKEVNLNDEIGLELQLSGPISENSSLSVSYMQSSSSKRWFDDQNGDWYNKENSFWPSSNKSSYPFKEVYIEFSGYSKSGKLYYKTGLDIQNQVFNVLRNSSVQKSYEIIDSQSMPILLSYSFSDLWNLEVQLEYQKLKTGFEHFSSTFDGNDNINYFYSLLTEAYQYNKFLSLSANYHQKWNFNLSHESTNADETMHGFDDSFDTSNTWSSIGIGYKFDSDDSLQIFYGSVRGGLDCTNGVCRYIQEFEDGLRIDYSSNLN
tara:strand:- start:954 stop:2639 length:1686 start_codon:yes stop_codon:yes gene_type:complete